MLVLQSLGRGSHEVQDQLLPVTSLKLPGRSHKVIFGCLLLVLELEVHGRGHTVN